LDADEKPSWTVRLLHDPELLCKKVREEAGELCETLENGEGRERTVSEMADLLYHSLVLLNHERVAVEDVLVELRRRFGTSGIDEKAARGK
jgi:phosphoribosyl-AMP cyclohydrolase / phosphoribosyl-ATP pyrophosphohydrolase